MFTDVRRTARRGRTTRRMGAGLLALVLAGAGVAACGGDDDADTGADVTPAPDTADDTADDTTDDDTTDDDTTDDGPTPSENAGAELVSILGLSDDDVALCADETLRAGAVLALTGPGAFYGTTMSRGIDLAVKHITEAGGMTFDIEYHDHRSGDPVASQQAITELGEAGFGAKFASYNDGLGAMLEGTANYEVFTFDGGGGTSLFAQSQPFFYGTRAITPNDAVPGLVQYITEAMPEMQTVGMVVWDLGEPVNSIIRDDLVADIEAAGLEFNGLYELSPVGSQDYSQILPRIQSNEPDIIFAGLWGQDIGSFVNQASVAGLDSQIFSFEFTPDGINASGGTFDSEGFWFAYDFFEPTEPASDFAEFFVTEFEAEYGELPDFYAANYYEDVLGMWDVARRVCADGGDINSGAALEEAFRADPVLQSVYCCEGSTVGTKVINLENHSTAQRPMGVFEYRDGEVTIHALFDMDAENFRLVD
jgi:branched-chain amino acid transport system substrate-binding protein